MPSFLCPDSLRRQLISNQGVKFMKNQVILSDTEGFVSTYTISVYKQDKMQIYIYVSSNIMRE